MATFNPGLLGVLDTRTRFNSEIYTQRTALRIPAFSYTRYYSAYAFTYGARIESSDTLAYPISYGIGISHNYHDLGSFIITSETSPAPIGTFLGYERVDALSLGAAIDLGATIGFGINIKRIQSSLSPIGSATISGYNDATPFAFDAGTFVKLPLIHTVEFHPAGSLTLLPHLHSTFAYVYSNMGTSVRYIDENQGDPLPREITAGYGIDGGVDIENSGTIIELFGFRFIREAEYVAARRNSNGSITYKYGLGEIQLYDNLIAGKYSERTTLRKGFELQLLNLVTLRSGSNKGEKIDFFTTDGFELNITGTLRYINLVSPDLFLSPIPGFFYHHIDIRYEQSNFHSNSSRTERAFHGFVLSVH